MGLVVNRLNDCLFADCYESAFAIVDFCSLEMYNVPILETCLMYNDW